MAYAQPGIGICTTRNSPTASLQQDKTPQTSILDMILNNLMVRFL